MWSFSYCTNTYVKVIFPNEQFDLVNEYNRSTSISTSKTGGIYSVLGTISFRPNNPNLDYRAHVEIRVSRNPFIAIDNDFLFGGIQFLNEVNVSTILQLEAGGEVEIFAQSNHSW